MDNSFPFFSFHFSFLIFNLSSKNLLPSSRNRAESPMYTAFRVREEMDELLPCAQPFVHRLSRAISGGREDFFACLILEKVDSKKSSNKKLYDFYHGICIIGIFYLPLYHIGSIILEAKPNILNNTFYLTIHY